jgi:hypothetical protein
MANAMISRRHARGNAAMRMLRAPDRQRPTVMEETGSSSFR